MKIIETDLKSTNEFKKYKPISKTLIDLKITFMAWHLSAFIIMDEEADYNMPDITSCLNFILVHSV